MTVEHPIRFANKRRGASGPRAAEPAAPAAVGELLGPDAVFASVWAIVRGKRGGHVRAEGWLPEQLEDDALVYVERTFRSREPPLMVARVDRAYRSRRGQITLAELKTRARVRAYLSDVVELSAQRHALSSETGEQVAPVAFVVVNRMAYAHRCR